MKRKRRRSNRLVIVLLSDTHAGHKLALLNPDTPLTDEHGEPYHPTQTVTQGYLWGLYGQHIEAVADLADGSPVMLVHNGDLTHGGKHVDHLSLVGVSDQIQAATWNLRPWCEHPRIALEHIRITVGTGSHGWEGGAESLIGERLADQYPKIDTRVLYHANIALVGQRGQVIDIAHHGPFPGSRKWLEGTAASYYLRSAMMDEIIDGRIPPIVYARAHYHTYLHVGPVRVRRQGRDVESRLIITPSYSGTDDYVRRVTRSVAKIDHGLVALEFDDGLKAVHPFFQELDIRSREEL